MEPEQDPSAEPVESGVEPSQKPQPQDATVVIVPSHASIEPYALSEAVKGFSDSGLRSSTNMGLLTVHIRSKEQDLVEAKRELTQLRVANDRLRDDLAAERTLSAVLSERLRAAGQQRVLRSVLITGGGILAGVSIPNLGGANPGYAIAGTIFAVVALAVGWFLPERGGQQGDVSR